MKAVAAITLMVAVCLGYAMPISAQVPCKQRPDFSPLQPPSTNGRIALGAYMYSLLTTYPDLVTAVAGARDAWNTTNAAGLLGGWTGFHANSSDCPSDQGQPPFLIGALDFEHMPCTTVDKYSTLFGIAPKDWVAFVDYHTPQTFADHGVSCPQCGTKSMLLNLGRAWSLNPDANQFDVQSIMTHEFGHMIGLAHMNYNVCRDDLPPSCAQDSERNTMGSWIYPGDTCERTLKFWDRTNADSIYPAPQKSADDFNHDGKADILWRNTSSGDVLVWLMNGTTVASSGSPGNAPLVWQIAGVGDFDGDGKTDILWRNTNSGDVLVWLMDGATVALLAGSGSPGSMPLVWQIAGVGDFNGDGKADILWRNTSTGEVGVWLMNGLTLAGSGVPGSASLDWQIAGVGDFNGDGKADILWRQTSGAVAIWFMNGPSIAGSGMAGAAGTDWTIARVGDFNGDGKADILWRQTSGTVAIWLMNGLSIAGSGVPGGSAGTDWTIARVSDFNGDGRADILWRQTSGAVAIWFIDGVSLIGSGSPGSVGTDWQIQ